MNGIIPLYKERGLTSHDCVNQLRKILHTKKIGHSGTLDPNVDGVLPICVGRATKVVEYLMESGKEYRGQLLIGKMTTTEDLDGEVVKTAPVDHELPVEEIEQAMDKMTGIITQIPPMYSAVKVNGRKLYEYARAGEKVERPSRQIEISKFKLTATSYDQKNKTQTVNFVVNCSKGTYVRTLAVDLADRLGYPGVMSDLTRTQSGGFKIDQTVKMDEIALASEQGDLDKLFYPLDYALKKYTHIEINEEFWSGVKNGVWLKFDEISVSDKVIALVYNQQVRALYQRNEEKQCYQPLKMLVLD